LGFGPYDGSKLELLDKKKEKWGVGLFEVSTKGRDPDVISD
jgi:hypothetical protein